ncbi:MAG: ECF transporter S component [Candidatus Dormibacteria bacterium]
MMLAGASLLGAALFLWPFLASGAPTPVVTLSLALGTLAALAAVEVAARRLDARRFALLAAIAGIDAALRLVLVTGVGGFSPIFFLVLTTGYVYGPSFGFLCGATSLLASAVATGGIGPWLPYEMFGCGWTGAVAGLAGLHRRSVPGLRDVALLAVVSVVAGYAYGALLDVWDWTTFYRGSPSFGFLPGAGTVALLQRFSRFYLATSAVWDSFRAAGDAVAVIVLGAPVMAGLARMRSRLSFTVSVSEPSVPEGSAARAADPSPALID